MSVIDGTILLKNNDCYKRAQKMTPKGIIVHSTGANNPNLSRYIGPDDGVIGKNLYNNHWNRGGMDVCVHGFLGKDKNGVVRFYQTLPFNYCCWGCGSGSKGSYNYNPAYIQFEICEDGLTNRTYFDAVYNKAVEVCAYLCKTYNISPDNVVGHKEAHAKGYASNHADPDHWFTKFGKSMNDFRNSVRSKIGCVIVTPPVIKNATTTTRSGFLRKNPWYDDLGGTSPKICSVPQGVKVTYITDDDWGWGKVTYGNQTGWIQNNRLDKKGISVWRTATFTQNVVCYKVGDNSTKKSFRKGDTAAFICQLDTGKFAGRRVISSGADYFVFPEYIRVGSKRTQ